MSANLAKVFILAIALEAKIAADKGDELYFTYGGYRYFTDLYEGDALPWVHFALFAVFPFMLYLS